jgi:hypothetical protein
MCAFLFPIDLELYGMHRAPRPPLPSGMLALLPMQPNPHAAPHHQVSVSHRTAHLLV